MGPGCGPPGQKFRHLAGQANCSGKLIGQPTGKYLVNVEGAGKDHTSPVALGYGERPMRKVSRYPFLSTCPKEWIFMPMRAFVKMSSSKGRRYFCSRVYPSVSSRNWSLLICITSLQPGNWFWPIRHGGPVISMTSDLAANIFWQQAEGDLRLATAFAVSTNYTTQRSLFYPGSVMMVWMQHPELDIEAKFAEVKGSALTADEQLVLQQRIKHAKYWVQASAPNRISIDTYRNDARASGGNWQMPKDST